MNPVVFDSRTTSGLMRRRRLLYPVGAALGLALLATLAIFISSYWPVHAQTATVPGHLSALTAEAKHERVTLSWEAPIFDGDSEITGYSVRYTEDYINYTDVTHDGTALTTSIIGLTNGTRYLFQVAAINSVGTGEYAIALATPVGLIKFFEFGYNIEEYDATNWSFDFDPNFDPDDPNDVDESDFISFVIHTSYLAAPYERDATIPFNVSLAEREANFKIEFELGGETREAVFCCNPAPYQNQRFFFRYQVTEDDQDLDGITVEPNSLSIADGFSFVDFDLIDVTDLSHPGLQLDGVNESLVLVNAPRPAPPQNVAVKEVGDRYFVVEWDVPDPTLEPINDAGGYTYRLWSTSATPVVFVDVPGDSSTTEVRIDRLPNGNPLVNGVEYSFVLYSVNRWHGLFRFNSREYRLEPGVVFKISSLFNKMTVTPVTTPSEPLSVTATGGTEEITLTWTASGEDGGDPISLYEYQIRNSGQQYDATWNSTDDSDGDPLSHVITGLVECTTYAFQMRAVNSIGNSPVSDEATAATDCPVGEVGDLIATGGNTTISVNWSAPSQSDYPVDGYSVQYKLDSESTFIDWLHSDTGTSTKITGLQNEMLYTVRVAATVTGSVGPYAFVMAETVAPAVTSLSATVPPDGGSVTLLWSTTAMGDDLHGGFQYQFRPMGALDNAGPNSQEWKVVPGGTGARGLTISDLINNVEYTFEVRTFNGSVTMPTDEGPPSSVTERYLHRVDAC